MTIRWNARRGFTLAMLLVQAWIALVVFDIAKSIGFRSIHRRLSARRVRSSPLGKTPIEDVVRAVDEACVWYVRPAACLQRSAALAWLLRRRGHDASVVIGFRPIPFESHAWVEVDGLVVNDRQQYRKAFTVLERL